MIVLDLSCTNAHRFEGWFASRADFETQAAGGLVACPICGSTEVHRLPSAPHVVTRSAPDAAQPARSQGAHPPSPTPAALVAEFVGTLRRLAHAAEDVGDRLPEEARRIHYGEAEARDIRGAASKGDIEALLDEGIMVLPVPADEDLH